MAARVLTSLGEIPPRRIAEIVWRGRFTVIIPGLLFGIIGVILAFTLPPAWEGRVRFEIQTRSFDDEYRQREMPISTFFTGSLDGRTPGAEFLSVFGSARFATMVAKETNFFDEAPGLKLRLERRSDENREVDPEAAMNRLDSLTDLRVDPKSGFVTLRARGKSPAQAAYWAGELLRRANALLRSEATERHSRNVERLSEELENEMRSEVHDALSALLEKEAQRLAFARSQTDYAFMVEDPPWVPFSRHAPRRKFLVLGLGILGGLIGILRVLGRETVPRD